MASGVNRSTRNWARLSSGIYVPDGEKINKTIATSQLIPVVKQMAVELENAAEKLEIKIPASGDLAKYVRAAKSLSDKWLLDKHAEISNHELYGAAYFLRVAEAILPLSASPEFSFYLNEITRGSLDFESRNQSSAKDFLWEAELFSLFRRSKIAVRNEEPDLVIRIDNQDIAVACKKIHSEKNVEKVFSNGVSQIERSELPGIVAFNIDSLASNNCVLRTTNIEEAGKYINHLNLKFLHHHERHFQKYMNSGRVLFAFVSMSVLIHSDNEIGANNMRQTTIWKKTDSPSDLEEIFDKVFTAIAGSNSMSKKHLY